MKSGDIPNLAAAYLSNFLRQHRCVIRTINLFQYEKEKLAEYLAQDPLCVAITTTFYVVNMPLPRDGRIHQDAQPAYKDSRRWTTHQTTRAATMATRSAPRSTTSALTFTSSRDKARTRSRVVESLRRGDTLDAVPNLAYVEAARANASQGGEQLARRELH